MQVAIVDGAGSGVGEQVGADERVPGVEVPQNLPHLPKKESLLEGFFFMKDFFFMFRNMMKT